MRKTTMIVARNMKTLLRIKWTRTSCFMGKYWISITISHTSPSGNHSNGIVDVVVRCYIDGESEFLHPRATMPELCISPTFPPLYEGWVKWRKVSTDRSEHSSQVSCIKPFNTNFRDTFHHLWHCGLEARDWSLTYSGKQTTLTPPEPERWT